MTYPLEEYIGNIDQLCNFISQRYYKLIDGRTENSINGEPVFFLSYGGKALYGV